MNCFIFKKYENRENPRDGDYYYNITNNKMYIYNDSLSSWIQLDIYMQEKRKEKEMNPLPDELFEID
jgi:hypothetical protein